MFRLQTRSRAPLTHSGSQRAPTNSGKTAHDDDENDDYTALARTWSAINQGLPNSADAVKVRLHKAATNPFLRWDKGQLLREG